MCACACTRALCTPGPFAHFPIPPPGGFRSYPPFFSAWLEHARSLSRAVRSACSPCERHCFSRERLMETHSVRFRCGMCGRLQHGSRSSGFFASSLGSSRRRLGASGGPCLACSCRGGRACNARHLQQSPDMLRSVRLHVAREQWQHGGTGGPASSHGIAGAPVFLGEEPPRRLPLVTAPAMTTVRAAPAA